MSWVSGHFVCGGGRTWTGYGTWTQVPKVTTSSASNSPLPSTEEEENTLPSDPAQGRGKYYREG